VAINRVQRSHQHIKGLVSENSLSNQSLAQVMTFKSEQLRDKTHETKITSCACGDTIYSAPLLPVARCRADAT